MSTAAVDESQAAVPPGLIVDVKAWMARFAFTPDLNFVRLERVAPAEWPPGSRQTISGALEDLLEPVDTAEIARRWGGGVYVVTALQVDGQNRRAMVDRKRIEIAGPPRSVPGPDGKPVPIVQPVAPSSPPASTPSVLDFNAALARQSMVAQENQTIAALQAAYRDARSSQENAEKLHRDEMNRLRAEMRASTTSQDAPLRDALAQAQRQMDKIIEAHQAQLDALRAQHETQMAAQLRTAEKAAEQREVTSRADIAAARQAAQQEAAQLRDLHRVELDQYKRELASLRESSANEQRELRAALESHRAEARAAVDRQASEIREAQRGLYEPQLQSLRAEVSEWRRRCDEVRAEARAEAERRERDVRAQLEAVNLAQQSSIQATLTARITSLEAELRAREERLDRADAELAELRQSAMVKADPTSAIRQFRELRDLVGDVTGSPNAPMGFLGQLAQVAGPLRENLVEPVLARVDRGLEVAAQEADRRNQMQAQLLTMRQRVGGQVKRRISTAGAPRRALPARVPPQQPAQPQAAARAAAPSVQPAASMQQSATQVLQQLEAWMNDGTEVAQAAAQIRGAVEAGLVPREILANVVGQTADALVLDIQSSARQLNLSALASPRGEEFLTGLHRALKR